MPRGCEGYPFGSVCMSVQMRNSKTIALIAISFFTQEVLYPWLGPPVRLSGSGRMNLFRDSSLLGDRTKYTTMSNVRYDENMRYDVTCAS